MNPTGDDSRIGLVLNGRYRITERLAEGGMGIVYKGQRIQLGKPVAIKFLLETFTDDYQFMARFEREARTMSQLSHPNCLSVIDFGAEGGTPYIVMDYVTGKTLRKLLNEGPVPVARTLHIAKQLLAALAHAHNQGIIHRDIKPGNVMLSEATGMGDHVRVFDFGLAKLLDAGASRDVSRSNIALGTPAYMSPEQTEGNNVDVRSDLYSIGIVLFELLTSSKPFVEENTLKLMRMHRETPPPPLSSVRGDKVFSAELGAVIAQALEKDPNKRFQTAKAFADALLKVPESKLALSTGEQTMTFDVPKDRRSIIAVLGVAAVFVGLAAAAWLVAGALNRAQTPTLAAGAVESEEDATEVVEVVDEDDPVPGSPQGAVPRPSDKVDYDLSTSSGVEIATDDTENASELEPPTLSAIRELVVAGQHDEALTALRALRRTNPTNAIYPYMMAGVFYEKHWLKDSLEQYREALRLNRGFRGKKTLNEHLIAMFASDKLYPKVRWILIEEVGRAALPYLNRAARNHEDPQVRRRAMSTATTISSSK